MDEGRNGATSDNNDNTEIQDEEENLVLPNVRKYQAIDDTTCIVPNYPDVNVVVNSSSTAKEINVRDSITNKKVILAPGEGCVPSNIMRKHDFDVKGFPLKHKTEIIASILRMKGHKVIIEKDGETDSIYVDGDLLIDYLVNTGQKLHEIIQKETFTITRMFDRKVKSLIKNVLMDRGVKGMNLKHYMYRIEFQARGKIRFIKFFEYTLAQIWLGD